MKMLFMPKRKLRGMSKESEIDRIYSESLKVVNEIFMAYSDASMGFIMFRDVVEGAHRNLIKDGKLTPDQSEKAPFVYGEGDPNESGSYPLIETSVSDFKDRNKKEGNNFRIVGNMCLILMYTYWEDKYRSEIAEKVLGASNKSEVKLDVMKDIKNYRNSIIHNKGVADKKTGKNEILKWFKTGDEIFVNDAQLKSILFKLREGLKELKERYA
jgi:hypothetical protein